MDYFFPYILKSSGILALFYLTYSLFLKKDTFFSLNRHFFLAGMMCSVFLPLITIKTTTEIEVPLQQKIHQTTSPKYQTASQNILSETPLPIESSLEIPIKEKKRNWELIFLTLYTIGILVFLTWFFWQLFTITRLISKGITTNKKGYKQIIIDKKIAPFSFNKSIVINPSLHTDDELDMIIKHEKIHVYQRHTYDILIVTLLCAFQWMNPFIWIYKKALQQNLEFIVDQEITKKSDLKKSYQLAIVQVASKNFSTITNNFHQSLIKKRIIMLNTERSNRKKVWKLFTIAPMLVVFMMSFNIKEEIKHIPIIYPKKPVQKENTVTKEETVKNETDEVKTTFVKKQNKTTQIPVVLKKIPKKKKETIRDRNSPNRIDEFLIAPTTTKNEIIALQKRLKDEFKTDLQIHTLEYHDGYISKINISFEDEFGNTGGIADEDNDSKIFNLSLVRETNENGEIEIFKFFADYSYISHKYRKTMNETNSNIIGLNEGSVYKINNTIYKKSELLNKRFMVISNIEVIQPDEAMKLYGTIAKDGIIIIENAIPFPAKELFMEAFYEKFGKEDITVRILDFQETEQHSSTTPYMGFVTYNKGEANLIKASNFKINKIFEKFGIPKIRWKEEIDPIIIIDNIVITYSELRKKDHSTFTNIMRIPDSKALKQYGDIAKNGAIIITTK
ncbi:M56 family metallopeptidase [uncultured Aquimarina sp.]|uniref:M56 family metallopeptidase n=1 Tax=uncultured Aquimarina sp. TaxID=575652 RepID=UPI00260DBC47|nr:M56 family metallopeptidase [uncultured Aquimarina sp.]